MNRNIIKFLLVAFCLAMFSSNARAAATFDNLTVNAAPTSVTIGQTSTVNVSWTTTVSSDLNVTGNIIASSPTGTYSNGLGNVINTLSYSYGQTNGLAGAIHVFNEPLILSAALTSQAATLGLTSIQYQRTFTLVEGTIISGTLQATATINLVTPPAAAVPPGNSQSVLSIDRIALRFNDNSTVRLVRPEALISAVAEIRYNGTGLLDAIWEVATPASTLGGQSVDRLIYTPLRSVRQYLGAGGVIYLQSPRLPAAAQGNYVVRLRVRQPTNLGFNLPILRYAVNPEGAALPGEKRPPLRLSAPANNALLQADTHFRWQAVRGARAYQLELYLAKDHRRPSTQPGSEPGKLGYDETSIDKQAPATGLLVPGRKTSLSIGALSRQHLRHGETYLWRILAIGAEGRIISSSPIREIRIP